MEEEIKTMIAESNRILNDNISIFKDADVDYTDTPISYDKISIDKTPILMTDEVIKKILEYIKKINLGNASYEYFFLLLGKKLEEQGSTLYMIYDLVDCSLDNLNSRRTNVDQEKYGSTILKAFRSGADIISIGHTHPRIDECECKKTIAYYLSDEDKKKHGIKEPGLNISLQDLINYNDVAKSIKEYNPRVKLMQTIIMYDGSIIMIEKEKDYVRYNKFYDLLMEPIIDFNDNVHERG